MKTTNLICSFSQIDYNLHFNYMLWPLLNPTFQIHWMRCHLYVCSEVTLISCDWHALPPPFMPGKLLLTSQTPSQLSSFETITSSSTLASIALNVSAANIFLSCLHPSEVRASGQETMFAFALNSKGPRFTWHMFGTQYISVEWVE